MRHDLTNSPTHTDGTPGEAAAPARRRQVWPAGRSAAHGRRTGFRTATVALAMTLALVLGACGSDGDEASGGNGGAAGAPDTAADPAPDGGSDPAPDGGPASAADGAPDDTTDTGGGAAPDAPAACSLLEPADIQAEFGGSVGAGEGDGPYCSWKIDDAAGNGVAAPVSLEMAGTDSALADGVLGADDATPIDGIGDEAVTTESGVVAVRRGDVVFALTPLFYPVTPATTERLTSLAGLVDGRL